MYTDVHCKFHQIWSHFFQVSMPSFVHNSLTWAMVARIPKNIVKIIITPAVKFSFSKPLRKMKITMTQG